MNKIVEKESPVGLVRISLALLNYFGGYIYLYPKLLEQFNIRYLDGLPGLTVWESWVITIWTLGFTVWMLCPYLVEGWAPFRKTSFFRKIEELISHEGLIILFSLVSSLFITWISGLEQSANQEAIETISGNYPLLIAFSAIVFAPFVEELLFRGVFYRTFRSKWGYVVCAIISSVLFGFLHVYDSILDGNYLDVIFILHYGLLGFAIVRIYERNQSILFSILLHMLHNSLGVLLLFLF